MKTILSCCVILLFALGCRKNNNNNDNQSSATIFPNKVGDTWTYLVNDTTYDLQNPTPVVAQYNMTVSIIDSVTLTGGVKANVWVYSYPNETDTNYVFQNGDTINFASNKRFYLEIVRMYIIPFRLHNSWEYSVNSIHDVTVDSQANIIVGKNQFGNSFHISGNPGMPDEVIHIDEWLEDNVGIVRRYVDGSGTNNPFKYRTLWSLDSYHLK